MIYSVNPRITKALDRVGTRNVPFCVTFMEDGYIEGVVQSQELNNAPDMIGALLSLNGQATMGLVKDTTIGTCFM